jgi:alpha-D-xyloside xylohydrolase
MNGIGNVWHIPNSLEPRSTMRDPLTQISTESKVAIFSGSQFQGAGDAGNQLAMGSAVFFKRSHVDEAWSSVPMHFDSAHGNNKYYVAELPDGRFATGDFVEYYLRVPFSDHLTTFIHGSDSASLATASEAIAQGSPFSFAVKAPGTSVSFPLGLLEARVFLDSGHILLSGPDLDGNAHATVITFLPPEVRIRGHSVTLAPVGGFDHLPDGLQLTYDLEGRKVRADLTFPGDGMMRFEVVDWMGLVPEQVTVAASSDRSEHFFGFGERFDSLDQSGKVVKTLTIDDPGTKRDHSYKAAPWFVSTRGYGFHFESSAECQFDLRASRGDRYEVTHQFSTLRFRVVYGPSLEEVLTRFTGYSGRPFLPPSWVFGPWISSDIWRSGGELRYAVTNFVGNLKGRGIPASAVVFDSPWETAYNDFEFNMTQFGKGEDFEGAHYQGFHSLSEMMTFLQHHGLKVICWMAPFVNLRSSHETLPNRFGADGALERVPGQNSGKASNYDEGASKGFFVRKKAAGDPLVVPWWKGEGSPVDFTNPAARTWFTAQLNRLLEQSKVATGNGSQEPAIGGFKTDDGETQNTGHPPNVYIPLNASYADGRNGAEMRNGYCFEYQKCVSSVLGEQGILFARSGFTGCQTFPAHWPGDNEPNFGGNGLPSVIVAGLSAAMSGYAIWGHDVGGYQDSHFGQSAAQRAELFTRWTQFACFSPIMQMHRQVHAQKKGDFVAGLTEELRQYPWGYGEEALANYQFFARLHTRLFPYIYSYAKEASTLGLPILRPLVLTNQDDLQAQEVEHSYNFGREFLIAPIIAPNTNSRRVYLPAGDWVDFWTNEAHRGKQTVSWASNNPLHFPVFLRDGSIVPLLPQTVQTLCDSNYVNNAAIAALPRDLLFLIHTKSASHFRVYDGTEIDSRPEGSARVVRVSSPARVVTLQVFGQKPLQVTLDGSSLSESGTAAEFDAARSGWRFDSATRFAFIKFAHAGGVAEVRC